MLTARLASTETVFGNKELLGLLHPDPAKILSKLQTSLVLGEPGCSTSIGTILCSLHTPGPKQD